MQNRSQYKSLSEWRKARTNDYALACKYGYLDDICNHFDWERGNRKPNGFWKVKENVLAEARKHKSRSNWQKNSLGSYNSAKKNNWFDECVAHMVELQKPHGYWTKERCLEEAKKYKTRSHWYKNNASAYHSAKKSDWFNECVAHMTLQHKPNGYWTKERCIKDAKKYKTKGEWSKNNGSSVLQAHKNKWFDECTSHMVELQKPAGYWTKERCIEDAKKYNTLKEWGKESSSSKGSAYKNGWVDECTEHMIIVNRLPGYWNVKENVLASARKYKTRSEWVNSVGSAYAAANRNGWVDECMEHMVELQKPNGYWNVKENVLASARNYDNIKEWQIDFSGAYHATKKNGWYEEVVSTMRKKLPNGYWNKKRCVEEAKKYNRPSDWQKNSSASYNSSKKNGWYEECIKHMVYTPPGYWNVKENVLASARKYKTRSEWSKNNGSAYHSAKKNGWFEEATTHIKKRIKPAGYWNVKENVLASARKYKSRSEWYKNSGSAYHSAKKSDWFDECVAHMKKKNS